MPDDLTRIGFSSYCGFNAQLIRWRYVTLKKYFHGDSCLELGSSDGQGTEYLLEDFEEVTAVDGSGASISALRERLASPRLTAVCSNFETLDLHSRFDTVLMGHVLEHVEDPQTVLRVAIQHLARDGVLIVDVPNGMSLHRQLGVEMGLLQTVTDLNDADRSIGHRRVYTPERFRAEIAAAGLVVLEFGGLFLKMLSNAQLEAVLDEEQSRAFARLGQRYPEIAAEMFIIASR